MGTYAVVDGSGQVTNVILYDGSAPYSPADGSSLVDVAGSPVAIGWTYAAATGFSPPVAVGGTNTAPATPAGPRYVPLATIRDRVTAAGKWVAFATALDALTPDKRWHLLTLQEGVASDDPDAIALLTAVGCKPTEILA